MGLGRDQAQARPRTRLVRRLLDRHGPHVARVRRRHAAFRESPRETERRLIETARVDGPATMIRIEQEPGASGKLYIDHLARFLNAFDVRGVTSGQDKLTRARPASAACERGDVFLVRGAWVMNFLDELCAFPGVQHDDQVDAFTGGYADLTADPEPWTAADVSAVLSYETEN
jgi:predicted phage terminase large subunit-like protein